MHAVMNRAESLALVVDAMTNFMIWERIVRTGPFQSGMGTSSARKMLAPMWLHNLDLLRKLVSECAARIMLLVG